MRWRCHYTKFLNRLSNNFAKADVGKAVVNYFICFRRYVAYVETRSRSFVCFFLWYNRLCSFQTKNRSVRASCKKYYIIRENHLPVIIIYIYVLHYSEKLHEGVIRDLERQQKRKTENIYVLQQQIELTKQLKNTTHIDNKDVSWLMFSLLYIK